jgi:WD40 repeat protein
MSGFTAEEAPRLLHKCHTGFGNGSRDYIAAYHTSDGEARALTAGEFSDARMEAWDISTGAFLSSMTHDVETRTRKDVSCLIAYTLPEDGRPCLASGHSDGSFRVWSGDSLELLASVPAHEPSVIHLLTYLNPSGGQLRIVSTGIGDPEKGCIKVIGAQLGQARCHHPFQPSASYVSVSFVA